MSPMSPLTRLARLSVPIALACGINAQSATLLKDLVTTTTGGGSMTTPTSNNWARARQAHTVFRGAYIFTANDRLHGLELWIADASGVRMLIDLAPGSLSSSPANLTVVGSSLYFSAYTAGTGNELWVTDGTAAGTRLVADLNPGPLGSNLGQLFPWRGRLVFSGQATPWITDGTAAGTTQITNLPLSPYDNDLLATFAAVGGRLLIRVSTLEGNGDWYGSDGTPAGTVRLAKATTSNIAASGNLGYFIGSDTATGSELWQTDGTPAGTRVAVDFTPGPGGSFSRLDAFAGGVLIVGADGPYFSDGTLAGTQRLAAVRLYETSATGPYLRFQVSGPLAYFVAGDQRGIELWRTDGTPAGTQIVSDLTPGSGSTFLDELTPVPGGLAFIARDAASGEELWFTDGSAAGTRLVADIAPGSASSQPAFLLADGGTLYFSARAQIAAAPEREPWTSNLTGPGTRLLRAISGGVTGGSSPTNFITLGARLVFTARGDAATGNGLFVTDGTASGTMPIGPRVNDPSVLRPTRVDESLFFTVGPELWVTDGRSAQLVRSFSVFPTPLLALGNKLLLMAGDAGGFLDLWASDGTAAGTVRILAADGIGQLGLQPGGLAVVGQHAFFTAFTRAGREPMVTDGTAAGTRLVVDLAPGGMSGASVAGVAFGGRYVFLGADSTLGLQLWETDGTAVGTRPLVTIAGASQYAELRAARGQLFLRATQTGGGGLWRTDGTAAGTRLLLSDSAFALAPAAADDLLFFRTSSQQLWSTDGTVSGTQPLAGVRAPSFDSVFATVGLGRAVLFSAEDAQRGRELWVSDGTSAGTRALTDVWPGPSPGVSITQGSTVGVLGDRLYFPGNNGPSGVEPFSIPIAAFAPALGEVVGAGCRSSVGRAELRTALPPYAGAAEFAFAASGLRPGDVSVLLLSGDLQPQVLGGGCTLYPALPAVLAAAAIVANGGTATLPLALPAGPWNLGRSFVAQAITFDAQGAFQNLLNLSNGLRVTLGRR